MKPLLFLFLLVSMPAFAGESSFWSVLQANCGKAFEGRMVEGTEPSDRAFADERMIMHVAECSGNEVRIPFHVGENRSRTWVLTRIGDGVRLKHDHRHENGTEDRVSQYGGDAENADALSLEFPADEFTARLLPAAASNVWAMEIVPGERFVYALRREAENRRFRVEFDLANPVTPPPPAW